MFGENIKIAIKSIRTRRLRSIVTLLGVIIGVAGVITSVSLAQGIKNRVVNETTKLGDDVLTIRPGVELNKNSNSIVSGINFLAPNTAGSVLTEKDLATVRDTEGVRLSVPLNLTSGLPTKDKNAYNDAVIIGTTPELIDLLNQNVEFGGFFNENNDKNFAVIGPDVAAQLFHENAPVGEGFNLRGKTFFVKGVLERQPTETFSQGINFNSAIFITYNKAKEINKGTAPSFEILAQVNRVKDIDQVSERVRQNLANNRGGQQDFSILKTSDTRAVSDSVISLISSMIVIIASVSMLVGGVGIMNVMLVSVSERTHEIGIRKAVGATDKQIANQFMVESMVLSIWGAILGIIVATAINVSFRIFTNIEPALVWDVAIFASVVSIIIGVVFGAAPAIKAARKNPIEALRSDS